MRHPVTWTCLWYERATLFLLSPSRQTFIITVCVRARVCACMCIPTSQAHQVLQTASHLFDRVACAQACQMRLIRTQQFALVDEKLLMHIIIAH